MPTGFVLSSMVANDLLVLANPLAFQALLQMRYPPLAAEHSAADDRVIDAAQRFEARRKAGAQPSSAQQELLAA
jgi:hypothetical protein